MKKKIQSNIFFTIENPVAQYGEVRCDGYLGYENLLVKLHPSLCDASIISAHADSSLTLHLKKSARICGALDARSMSARKNSCRFFINGGLLGHVYTSMNSSMFVNLPPGKYELNIQASPNNCNARTIWCLFPDETPNTMITLENTFFAVCSNYPENDSNAKDWALKKSSAISGIQWSNTFSGGEWQCNYQHKILDTAIAYRKALAAGKRFVLFVDARDTVLRHSATVLLGRLNELYRHRLEGKILFAADTCGYNVPVGKRSWEMLLHKKIQSVHVYANSGTYFGELETASEMLDYAIHAHEAILNQKPFDEGTSYWIEHVEGRTLYRDQGYIQLYHLRYPERVFLDMEKELFACITGDLLLKKEPSHYHSFLTHTICNASFVHAPLPSHNKNRWKTIVETVLSGIDVQ